MERSARSCTDGTEESTSLSELAVDEKRIVGNENFTVDNEQGCIHSRHSAKPPEEHEAENEQVQRSQLSGRYAQEDRTLKLTRSHHSRAGGDGFTCFDLEPNTNAKPEGVQGEQEKPFLIASFGDSDSENPRNMGKLRRWAIVFICAASSLCVYVDQLLEAMPSMLTRITRQDLHLFIVYSNLSPVGARIWKFPISMHSWSVLVRCWIRYWSYDSESAF